MRVFVTGASGWIGSVTVKSLIREGYEVVGLARSDASAQLVESLGARAHRGDVTDIKSLQAGIEGCDGVIHTAFIHDFSKFQENCEIDRRAIAAMGEVLLGSNRPMIVTSGTGLFSFAPFATEDMAVPASAPVPRIASEHAAEALMKKGVNVSIVRLPPSVHGVGDHGFVPILFNLAKQKGVSAYVGDGSNIWPGVHRLDAAEVFRLALEKAPAKTRLHAVAEEGVPFKKIAEAIGRQLNLPIVSLSADEAAKHFEWFAHFASMSNRSSSQKTRDLLGWQPKQISLLEDIAQLDYFKSKN